MAAWHDELDLAVGAAKAAGARLKELFHQKKEVLSSEGRDIKLQADRDSEAIILAKLRESNYAVLAEESGEHGDLDTDAPIWIVDPLDGTMNFSRQIPICCVSIGLSKAGHPFLGVIYDFNHDDLFTGIVGEGAWWNGAPMSVSSVSEAPQGVLTTGFPTHFDFDDDMFLKAIGRLQRFKKVRMLGSAALMLADVACGRTDAYAEDHIMYWDVAAGLALVEAAGGHFEVADSGKRKWCMRVRCASDARIWDA